MYINFYCDIDSLCSQNVAIMLNYAQVREESYYAQNYAGIMCHDLLWISQSYRGALSSGLVVKI